MEQTEDEVETSATVIPAIALDKIQAANWSGCIPVLLTLAPTSLSSPTLPPPVHVLVNRQSFLHVALQAAVERLQQFAPTQLLFTSGMKQNEPTAMVQDDDREQNLQSEAQNGSAKEEGNQSGTNYPICWFEDQEAQLPLRWHVFAGVLYDLRGQQQRNAQHPLPWKIHLHFTQYPQLLLPLQQPVLQHIQQHFKNSFKQALCLQSGNNKIAMNVRKESHVSIWHAVSTSNLALYKQVPIYENNGDDHHAVLPTSLPIRIHVNSEPPLQRPCRRNLETTTLGQLLHEWLPRYFPSATDSACRYKICGITPPLTSNLLELWRALHHPDNFLYVIVLTG